MTFAPASIAFTTAMELARSFSEAVGFVGDGCTIAGLWKGLKDLYAIGFIDKLPRLISVQAEGCCPLAPASIAFTTAMELARSFSEAVGLIPSSFTNSFLMPSCSARFFAS